MKISPLDCASPRKIEPTGIYICTIVVLPAILLTCYLAILVVMLPTVLRHKELRDHGIEATGRVTALYKTPAQKNPVYHVYYDFQVGPPHYQGEDSVDASEFTVLSIGGPVPILHENAAPYRSAINISEKERHGFGYVRQLTLLEVMSGILLLPSILWTIGCYLIKEHQGRLLRWGTATRARIHRRDRISQQERPTIPR